MKPMITLLLAIALASCGSSEADDSSSSGSSVWAQGPSEEESSDNKSDSKDSKSSSSSSRRSKDKDKDDEPEVSPAALPRGSQPTAGCERFYVLGKQPKIVEPKLRQTLEPKMEDLCYRAFAVRYSGLTRTPIWVAEALTSRQLDYARSISRASEFMPDPSLSVEARAELDDYRRSGFDRGHMAPSADMPTREAQAESFYLSNIVPQNGVLNGGKWAELEKSVRNQAKRGDVYVITGPIFQNARQALRKRVLVPTSVFKAIFVDGDGAVVYVAENKANGRWDTFTIEQFKAVYGIDLYPGLPALVRNKNLATNGSLRKKQNVEAAGADEGKGNGRDDSRKKKTWARKDGTGVMYSVEDFRRIHKRMPNANEYVEM